MYGALTPHPTAEDDPIRDIVVAGGSAGSLEALRDIVSQLPPDWPLAMFLVVHILPTARSRLPQILTSAGCLHVRHACDGDLIVPGRVLVAPPDRHLLLEPDRVRISHGPRENSTRPAADPLFRSAASAFGARVCGVVLSGHLDDGSEGLRLIAEAGGLAIVQDPEEAPHPEMPLNALRRVPDADVLAASAIGQRLSSIPRKPAEVGGNPARRGHPPLLEVQIGAADTSGVPTGLTCPECGGVLWAEPGTEGVQCRVGHRNGLETLWDHKNLSVEQSVWAAVRALQEDASLAEHMATRARSSGSMHTAVHFERRHRDAMRHSEVLRRLLLEREPAD